MITDEEKARYPLAEQGEVEILELIHRLEENDLTDFEKLIVSWARTQLEEDWRAPLAAMLNLMIESRGKSGDERFAILKEYAEQNFWKP